MMRYKDYLSQGSLGPHTGQTHQFADPPGRGKYGGIKIELSSNLTYSQDLPIEHLRTGSEIVEMLKPKRHWRILVLHAESVPSPQKYVTLSDRRDRFGDPFAHVHYDSSDFDHETYRFGRKLFDRFVAATRADEAQFEGPDRFNSAAHHMGTCRMGLDIRDSVVDRFGKVHGTPNLFVVGGSNMATPSPFHPTLTMVALAIRTAEYILDQML